MEMYRICENVTLMYRDTVESHAKPLRYFLALKQNKGL